MNHLKFYSAIALQVVVLFMASFLFSYLTEYLQNSGIFDDTQNTTATHHELINVDEWHTWGTRHYIWYWMGFTLFILGLIRTIHFVVYQYDKIFPSK